MASTADIIENLKHSLELPNVLSELQAYWDEEQKRRMLFYDMLDNGTKAEFINGEVIIHSPAKAKQIEAVGNLSTLLNVFVKKNDLGKVFSEKALIKLTRNDFEPDICFFRKETASKFDKEMMFFPPPDFVAEVLSESTENIDRTIKMESYALNGIQEYWIVDADKHIVEQYLLKENKYYLVNKWNKQMVKSFVIKGFEIPAEVIFSEEDTAEFFELLK